MQFEHRVGPEPGETGHPFFAGNVIEGGRVVEGDGRASSDPSRAVVAAACRNYGYWLRDITLETTIVILSDPELYRSAELLDGEYRSEQISLDVEQKLLEGQTPAQAVSSLQADGASASELSTAQKYLGDRATAPAADVRDHYVVYAASVTLLTVLVGRLEVDPERERVDRTANRILSIDVTVSPTQHQVVDEESCWTEPG